MKEIRGIVVPFATPFTRDEEIDVDKAKLLADQLIASGVHALIILGDTGEFFMLTPEERLRFTEIMCAHINGRVPVVIQPSALSTRESVMYAKQAKDLGADALMLLPSYYRSTTQTEAYTHFATVADATDLPIICYCLPQAGAEVMTPEFLAQLSEIDTIRYVKDSTGILARIRQIRAACGDRIKLFIGGDSIVYDGLVAGAIGSIWGCGNFMPEQTVELYSLVCEKGDLVAARALWDRMFPLCDFVDTHPYASSVKAALQLTGFDAGAARLPARSLSSEERADLADRLRNLGLRVTN